MSRGTREGFTLRPVTCNACIGTKEEWEGKGNARKKLQGLK